ncbi:hypothetical protein Patl1_11386 [Pistacia atlantica]|uniref:Uncharacterized protein n=1 Tax=Pistacia atlantica TaxID=434234 RepID=A0ACC1A5Y3_9ROSI|nr:hypothetical protein Patl1_11386 [Pistacia atlantica]
MDDQWKKRSGAGNWDGLLKPLDKALGKRLKLHCESIQVIYDSVSHHDKRQPAHEKEDLFSKMEKKELEKLYTVTHYIYASHRSWKGSARKKRHFDLLERN